MDARPEPDARPPTVRQRRAAQLASGAALWRLNDLGLLGEALAAALHAGSGVRIDGASARDVLHDAYGRGEWTPKPVRPVGFSLQAERARRYEAELAAKAEPAAEAVSGTGTEYAPPIAAIPSEVAAEEPATVGTAFQNVEPVVEAAIVEAEPVVEAEAVDTITEPPTPDAMADVRSFIADHEAWTIHDDEAALRVEFKRIAGGRTLNMETALSHWRAERVRRYEAAEAAAAAAAVGAGPVIP